MWAGAWHRAGMSISRPHPSLPALQGHGPAPCPSHARAAARGCRGYDYTAGTAFSCRMHGAAQALPQPTSPKVESSRRPLCQAAPSRPLENASHLLPLAAGSIDRIPRSPVPRETSPSATLSHVLPLPPCSAGMALSSLLCFPLRLPGARAGSCSQQLRQEGRLAAPAVLIGHMGFAYSSLPE